MENSQFLLKWNNHQPTVVSVLDYLLNQEAFIDVTLACEGQSFSAHKVILSACSPYFQDLLMKNPCKHPIIFLKDVRSCDMESLLQFMYRGEINVQQDDLAQFLKTAESLQIKGLADNAMKDPGGSGSSAGNEANGESDADDTRDSAPAVDEPPPPPPPAVDDTPTPSQTPDVERERSERAERAERAERERERAERAAERAERPISMNRSLLATALGKLGAGWPPSGGDSGTDGVSPASLYPAVSMDFEQAGPSRLAIATPPPSGLFPYALTPSPGAVTPSASVKEEPSLGLPDPDWASGTSGAGSTVADSPERGSENGDVRDPLDSPEKGVVSVNPAGWKHANLYPHGRGRPRAQPLPRLYECNLCGKTFNNRRRDRFLAHLRLHTGERPFKCLICGRGFNRQDHVTVHMRLHTGGKPFQCIVCKHRFAKQQELKSHACVGPMMPPENGITITPTSAVDFRTYRVRSQLNGSPARAESGD